MSSTVRIATFNCENLFARYYFKKGIKITEISKEGWDINKAKFGFYDPKARYLTGKAIREIKADILALQEVENLDVLKRFRSKRLGGFKAYPYLGLIAGNDPRLIDVAVLSKYPIVHMRSYQHIKKSPSARDFIFSRDCLEVDIDIDGFLITLYVNHFKSMIGGRIKTRERRLMQVKKVKELVMDRWGSSPGNRPFIILGDFNDYMETDSHGSPSIATLVSWDQVENVVERLPASERWTHYYKRRNDYRQLDYILVSKALKSKVKKVEIERHGMPRRAKRYTGPRFPGVGDDHPKASDHCPVVVELDLSNP